MNKKPPGYNRNREKSQPCRNVCVQEDQKRKNRKLPDQPVLHRPPIKYFEAFIEHAPSTALEAAPVTPESTRGSVYFGKRVELH